MKPILPSVAVSWLLVLASAGATTPDFQSKYQAISLSRTAPVFTVFSLDSLGQGRTSANPVLPE
jgi:hypothetical protein